MVAKKQEQQKESELGLNGYEVLNIIMEVDNTFTMWPNDMMALSLKGFKRQEDCIARARENHWLGEKTKINVTKPTETSKVDLVHASKIREIGAQIISQTVKVGEKYLELCEYIRKNSIGPKIVSEQLSALGFHRVRISEINKVANSADEVWEQYRARAIGFKGVLQLTRGSMDQLKGTKAIDVESVKVLDEVAEKQHEDDVKKEEQKERDNSPQAVMTRHAIAIFKVAGKEDTHIRLPKVWKGPGFQLTLTETKVGPKTAKASAENKTEQN